MFDDCLINGRKLFSQNIVKALGTYVLYTYYLSTYDMYMKLLLDKLRVLEKYSQHLSTFIDLPFKK